MFGDAAGQNDPRLEAMCDELRIVIVVPDYRKAGSLFAPPRFQVGTPANSFRDKRVQVTLIMGRIVRPRGQAPEDPYPAALHDCEAGPYS